MAVYSFSKAVLATGAGTADAVALSANAYMAIVGGSTTQIVYLDEVYLEGQAASSAPQILLLGLDSTLGSTGSALTSPDSFGPVVVNASLGTAPTAFVTVSTTQPQRSSSVTVAKKHFGFNAFGGLVRCNYANTMDRYCIKGSAASVGEMSLSAFTGTTSANIGGHLLVDAY